MAITGWFMFILGSALTVFALGWSLYSWRVEDRKAEHREDREGSFINVNGEDVRVPPNY